jgi:hypothetical protein
MVKEQTNTVVKADIVGGVGLQPSQGVLATIKEFLNIDNAVLRLGEVDEEFAGTQGYPMNYGPAVRRVYIDPELELNMYMSEKNAGPILEQACGGDPTVRFSDGGGDIQNDAGNIIVDYAFTGVELGVNTSAVGAIFWDVTVPGDTIINLYLENARTTLIGTCTISGTTGVGTVVEAGGSGLGGTIEVLNAVPDADIYSVLSMYSFDMTNHHDKFLSFLFFDGYKRYEFIDVAIATMRFSSRAPEGLMLEFTAKGKQAIITVDPLVQAITDWTFFAHKDSEFLHDDTLAQEVALQEFELELDNTNRSYGANADRPITQIKQFINMTGSAMGLLGDQTRVLHEQAWQHPDDEPLIMQRFRANYSALTKLFRVTIFETQFRGGSGRQFFGTEEVPDFELEFGAYRGDNSNNRGMPIFQLGIGK